MASRGPKMMFSCPNVEEDMRIWGQEGAMSKMKKNFLWKINMFEGSGPPREAPNGANMSPRWGLKLG